VSVRARSGHRSASIRLRCRAIERAQFEADLAQRRFMLVDPANRLVADTLEAEWNDKLRTLAQAREERERARQQDQFLLDDAIRQRLEPVINFARVVERGLPS
jgi:hypothetical protein